MSSPLWVGYTGIVLLLGGTLIVSNLAPHPVPQPLQQPLTHIRSSIAGWNAIAEDEQLDPRKFTATSYLARTYIRDEKRLTLLVGFYASHREAVSVHTPKNCLPGDGWEIWTSGSPTFSLEGRSVTVNQYQIYRANQRLTVLYWYQSPGRVVANEYVAKLILIRDALLDGRTSGSFVRIAMPDEPDSLRNGFQFAQEVMRELHQCFGR